MWAWWCRCDICYPCLPFFCFLTPNGSKIVTWRDPSRKHRGQLCEPVASRHWTEDPSGLLFPSSLPGTILTELWNFESILCLSERSRTMVNSIYNDLILLFGSLHGSPDLVELGSWALHTEWLSWGAVFLRRFYQQWVSRVLARKLLCILPTWLSSTRLGFFVFFIYFSLINKVFIAYFLCWDYRIFKLKAHGVFFCFCFNVLVCCNHGWHGQSDALISPSFLTSLNFCTFLGLLSVLLSQEEI